jgi:hypothetical protein
MFKRESHIKSVYLTAQHRSPQIVERVLVIETDLKLPQSRFAPRDPRIEDLLIELNEMKQQNPVIFRSVDTIEIRDMDTHINHEETHEERYFPFVPGERVPSSRFADLPTV